MMKSKKIYRCTVCILVVLSLVTEVLNYTTYLCFIVLVSDNYFFRVFPEISQEAAIGHEGHDNVRSRSSIKADTNQGEDIWMFKLIHLRALLQHLLDHSAIIEPYKSTNLKLSIMCMTNCVYIANQKYITCSIQHTLYMTLLQYMILHL